MKTNLTLKTGAFYFLSTANLTRNVSVPVDLETLSQAELDSIKAYIAVGHIESSEEISKYNVEEQSEAPVVKEEKTETAPEEAKEVETEVKEDYTEMTVKELKAEIAKRNIDTEATRKDDLIKILKEKRHF